MSIPPKRLQRVTAYVNDAHKAVRGCAQWTFGTFVQLSKHVYLALALRARARLPQPEQRNVILAAVIPPDREFFPNKLDIIRLHACSTSTVRLSSASEL